MDRIANCYGWGNERPFKTAIRLEPVAYLYGYCRRTVDHRGGQPAALRQPSVSNALKRLEDQIGARLIDRDRGRFEVTEQGLALYHECREICGAIGRLSDVMSDSGNQLSGHLHLWLASHVVFPPLDDALFEFNREHPEVTYEINVATSGHVTSQVLSQQASFGICLVNEQHPGWNIANCIANISGSFAGRHIICLVGKT